ncbi:hypothetical protein KV205_31820 [Streptomyces sp. SKN60]|uniref:hypothetical protein n=1 Tax=Streptomyces sp. SKN60 TaxID=2855506 RepID=UPI002247F57B|nr:hypothetical protein [Streptomyces sp. SKN60]MCX2185065.1 hypothetical protein [Streptomyces sp. SKN60]
MGHSRAYPVFRSDDADAAYARAQALCRGLEFVEDERWVEALVGDAERVRAVAGVVPGALFEGADKEAYDPWGDRRAACFPVWVFEEHASADVELPFLRAVGEDPAMIGWRGRWPGAHGRDQYDGVQVSFHSDDVELDPDSGPVGTHTVFLHVDKGCPSERVRELAARAGSELLGAARIGW